jgi:hypothetical protein
MTSSIKVLVYQQHHTAANTIVPNGLAVITTSELETILKNRKFVPKHQRHPYSHGASALPTASLADTDLQCTTKPISRGALNVDIYERDLLTDAQKAQFADLPNYESNVAGVSVPFKVFLGKLVGSNDFDNLVILSAKR